MKKIRRNVFANSRFKRLSLIFVLALCLLIGLVYVGMQRSKKEIDKNLSPEEIFKKAKLKQVDKQNPQKEVCSLIAILRKTKPTIKFKGDNFRNFALQSPEAEQLVKIGEGAIVLLFKEATRSAKLIKEENYDDIVEPDYIRRILLKIGKPKVVPHLIRFLSTGNVDERRLAAEAFVYGFVDESALPALIQTLKDKDNLVRYTAATALGILGMKEAIPALKEASQDKVKYVREETKRAIEEIQEQNEQVTKAYSLNYSSAQEIKESLEKALNQLYGRRKIVCDKKQNCLIITDSVNNHKKIKEAITRLDQPKPQFTIKFTYSCNEKIIGESRVVALLDRPASINIGDKDSASYSHYEVTPSLTKKGGISLQINFEIKEEDSLKTGKTRIILKDGETKKIAGLKDKWELNISLESTAIEKKIDELLMKMQNAILEIPNEKNSMLKRKNDKAFNEAGTELAKLGKSAIPHLLDRAEKVCQVFDFINGKGLVPLKKEASESDANTAAMLPGIGYCMEKIGKEKALPFLIERFENTSDNNYRFFLLSGISGAHDESAIELLETVLVNQKEVTKLREIAASALGAYNNQKCIEALISVLKEDKPSLKKKVVVSLGNMGSKEATLSLIPLLLEKDEVLRAMTVDALRKIGDKRAVESLISLLKDNSLPVRMFTVRALGQLKDFRAVPYLKEALNNEDYSGIKEDIKKALNKIRNEEK